MMYEGTTAIGNKIIKTCNWQKAMEKGQNKAKASQNVNTGYLTVQVTGGKAQTYFKYKEEQTWN